MIRLLLRLLRIKDFDICASCATLKEQLIFEREEKRQLTETLINIVSPKAVIAAPQEIQPIAVSASTFTRKRAILEARDREEARIRSQSSVLGKPDNSDKKSIFGQSINQFTDIEQLEKELGVGKEN